MIGPTNGDRQYRIIVRSECGPLLASLIANLQVEPGRSGYTCAVALVRDDPEPWGLIEQLQDLALHSREDHQQRLRCSEEVVRGGVEPPTFRFSGALSRPETKNAKHSAAQLRGITAGQPPTRPS
jgi:hypothetical protein